MSEESQQKTVFKDPATQELLNKPVADPSGVSSDEESFLNLVLSLVNEGKIDIHAPSSLINNEVYDKLDPMVHGKVDLEAVNLVNSIRQIKDLYDNGFANTFQMKSLVSTVFNIKNRLELYKGDVFII